MNKLVLLFAALFALSAVANEFVGKVTKVSDGDTIWVMTEGKREKVRMDRIDAPEKNQKFGKEASAILAAMIDGKEVRVEWKKRDRYGRVLGVVFEGEKEVNLEMIRKGAAWHYSHFDKTAEYAEAEKVAREAKVGLWKYPNPINPYDWRKKGKK